MRPKEKQTKVEVDSRVTKAMRRGKDLGNEGMVRPLRRESLAACRGISLKKSDGRGRQSRKEKAQAAGLQGVKESSEEGTLGSNEGCFGLGNPVGT